MKRNLVMVLTVLAALFVAAPVFAQAPAGGGEAGDARKWVIITAGFAMAIASAGGAYAQSKATAAACAYSSDHRAHL